VEGQITPRLLVSGFDLEYAYDGAHTRLIVVPSLTNAFATSLNGDCLSGLDSRIISIEAASLNGAPLRVESLPVGFRLHQNYPNPFNPTTTIGFNLPGPGRYRLEVFNIQGQLVGQVERRANRAGYHTIEWDGSGLASGLYLYRLEAGSQSSTRKMLLLK
jgi:type IX secretion system substrate protein